VGMVILSIPKIPGKIRNINTGQIRSKVDTEGVKQNLSRLRDEVDNVKENYSNKNEQPSFDSKSDYQAWESDTITTSGNKFSSEEKERTVLILQLASGAFIIFAILHIFNFINFLIFIILDGLVAAYIIYSLFNKIKLMYPRDFNAYRDFFLMYLAVGIIIVLVSGNSSLVMAFSFQALPSLSVLIYAIIAVFAVFLIFRMRYYRDFTYGTVIEAGKNTAHVKIEYDIRSNVKPDIYLVENRIGAAEGDDVKIKIEDKVINTGGNKPLGIMEVYKKDKL
jgi:uncharacterized membrane protein